MINAIYADQDYGALANQLFSLRQYMIQGALVVLCWHHGNIPSMAHALRASLGSYPDPWHAQIFNQIIVLDYASNGQPDVKSLTEPS